MAARIDFAGLEEIGDGDFIDEMILLFMDVSSEQSVAIRRAIEKSAASELIFAAHKLRSTSLAIFAITMGELADMLEQAGRSGDLEVAPDLYRALEVATHETGAQLRAALGSIGKR